MASNDTAAKVAVTAMIDLQEDQGATLEKILKSKELKEKDIVGLFKLLRKELYQLNEESREIILEKLSEFVKFL